MYKLLQLSDITVHKRFEANDMTEAFCGAQQDFPLEMCQLDDDQMDCTNVNNFGNTPCFLKEQAFDNVLFNFPADDSPAPVADFSVGQSNQFFKDYNLQNGSLSHFKFMKSFTLYETKFDLSTLSEYADEQRTKKVVVRADTVYTSAPLMINHELEIHARVVAIRDPITMKMTRDDFF